MYDCACANYAVPVMTAKDHFVSRHCSCLHVFTTTMPGKKHEKERKREEAAAM